MKTYLEIADFHTEVAYDGQTGLNIFRKQKPDLILLDIMLPLIDGNELCRIIRKESDVPIIMLTAKGSSEDKITGLNGGADDYIVKPFEPEEVILRINAVLKRSMGLLRRELYCGRLRINEQEESVYVDDKQMLLTHAQFSILSVFANNPGVVLSRRQIIEQAFNEDFDAYERAIDTHIRRLRKIFHRSDFHPIKTVYGGGYKMVCSQQ